VTVRRGRLKQIAWQISLLTNKRVNDLVTS